MLPALASLIVPGLGQFLTGRRARGVAVFALVMVMLVLVAWWVTPIQGELETPIPVKGDPNNAQWLIVVVVVWLWNGWDAARPGRPGGVVVVAAVILFYAVGWQAIGGDVSLLTQNVERALQVVRPMLQPDFVRPRADVRQAWVTLIVPCPPDEPEPGPNTIEDMTLTLSAGCAKVGDTVEVTGIGFQPDVPAELIWQSPIGDFFPLRRPGSSEALTTQVDAQGQLTVSVVVPKAIPPGIDPNLPQDQRVYIRQSRELGGIELSTNGAFIVQGVYESIAIAIMATTLGTLLAMPFSFLAARNLMSASVATQAIYVAVRTALNVVRSIEPLIIAIVFVVIVGLGPFAGMLAVMMHTIAALGKLFSEVIEGIDPGPIEAMQATGANWLQVVRYGVVPQIIPPFTAFTIYRLEINVRTSTIVGLVGGGGIGFFLVQWINLSDFRAVGATFLAILVVVMTMDFVSARLRARLI